eukprot:scaffold2326_cov72-Cylindrotheca_fusiformis.AAC.2
MNLAAKFNDSTWKATSKSLPTLHAAFEDPVDWPKQEEYTINRDKIKAIFSWEKQKLNRIIRDYGKSGAGAGAEGDHYLGQALSGKDPMKASFEVLPPHWKMPNPMVGHQLIQDVMTANFGPILTQHSKTEHDPTESDRNTLLDLVTVEPTPEVMTTVTGVPPHIATACQIKLIQDSLIELITQSKSHEENQAQRDKQLKEELAAACQDEIEANVISKGNITAKSVSDIIEKHQDTSNKKLTETFSAMLAHLVPTFPAGLAPPNPQPLNRTPQGGGLLVVVSYLDGKRNPQTKVLENRTFFCSDLDLRNPEEADGHPELAD